MARTKTEIDTAVRDAGRVAGGVDPDLKPEDRRDRKDALVDGDGASLAFRQAVTISGLGDRSGVVIGHGRGRDQILVGVDLEWDPTQRVVVQVPVRWVRAAGR